MLSSKITRFTSLLVTRSIIKSINVQWGKWYIWNVERFLNFMSSPEWRFILHTPTWPTKFKSCTKGVTVAVFTATLRVRPRIFGNYHLLVSPFVVINLSCLMLTKKFSIKLGTTSLLFVLVPSGTFHSAAIRLPFGPRQVPASSIFHDKVIIQIDVKL